MPLEHDLMGLLATTIKEVAASVLCKTLNDIVRADPVAMHALCETRFYCKKAVETDTLAVPSVDEKADGALQLGMLGVLNAVAGLHGLLIIAHYGDDGRLLNFTVKVKEAPRGNADAKVEGEHGPQLREAAPQAEEGGEGQSGKDQEGGAG